MRCDATLVTERCHPLAPCPSCPLLPTAALCPPPPSPNPLRVIVIVRVQQAIAQHVSDTRGIDVTEDMFVVGPGCKPGLFFATMALVEKGDEVICPDPGFPT